MHGADYGEPNRAVSLKRLRQLSSQPRWEADDVTEVAEALPVLLDIAEAVLDIRDYLEMQGADTLLRALKAVRR